MPKSRDGGLAASTSEATTSIKHNRTNLQLQPATDPGLNQYQSITKGRLLTIEKEGYSSQVKRRHQTTRASSRDGESAHPSRAMQWTLLVAVAIITLVTLVVPLAFAVLKGQALLAIPSFGTLPLGYAWVRLVQFVFPVNQRDHEYRIAKLKQKCSRQCQEGRGNRRIWRHKQSVQ